MNTMPGRCILALSLLLSLGTVGEAQAAGEIAKDLRCRGCVGTKDLGRKAVGANSIRANAVTSAHIQDGQVGPADLADNAQPVGANFSSLQGADFTPLPQTSTVVASVTLDLPGAGVVIANASAYAQFVDDPSGVICGIVRQGAQKSSPGAVIAQNHADLDAKRMPVAATAGFVETAAGAQTYNLVCLAQQEAELHDAILTVVYAPNSYGPVPTE